MGLFSGQRPDNLGVREGKLSPCAAKPNCVASQADPNDTGHYIAPFVISGPVAPAWAKLVSVLREQPRAVMVVAESSYLHAEFTSRLMGYVDDVEFVLDENNRVIHVRSASRLGTSDFGVNRKRIEVLRESWRARQAPNVSQSS
ncbi:MAG: DUF1499 domain-containing protein [Burkholderiales bacterium]